jgi:hypothetical protein
MRCCNLALKFSVPLVGNENPLISAFPGQSRLVRGRRTVHRDFGFCSHPRMRLIKAASVRDPIKLPDKLLNEIGDV